MENYTIYQDIAERTGGDIYIGVVGPVRTGKSTFIKNFMEAAVIPNIKDEYKKFLTTLPWLFGGYEMIEKAKKLAFNEDVKKNILYLEKVFLNLKELGYEKYISVDMSMVPRVNYYSGIIFKGYIIK